MLSQFFILSSRGDTLVFRDYRGDIVKGTAEIFFRRLNAHKEDQAAPIFTVEGNHFIFIKKGGLYFVATTKSNTGPTFVVELLNRIANICKDYCGVLNEESLRCNFTLIYEILDEVLFKMVDGDWIYGRFLAKITTEELFAGLLQKPDTENVTSQATGPNVFGNEQLTLPSSASNIPIQAISKKGGRKNEVFVDVLERLTVLYTPNGNLIRSEIDGCVQVKSFLAGNPEIRIGLNDNLSIGHDRSGSYDEIQLDDYSLHEKVDADVFESTCQLNIIPPDGEFVAMSYRLSGEFCKPLPFRLHPYIDEIDDGKALEISLKLSCELPASNAAANILLRIPVPRATMSVSHDVTTGSKTTEFKSNDKVILWGIKKMFGKKEHFAKFKIILSNATSSARQEIGPISINFEVPMFVCSGISIRFLKVYERNNLYTPMRWIRLITHCDSFVHRL